MTDDYRPRLRRAAPWAVLGFLGFAALSYFRPSALVPEGKLAPALVTNLDDGTRFDLAAERGRVVVVNFWGTYCPPCRAEAPVLSRAHRRLLPRGGKVVGIAVDPTPLIEVASTARKLGMQYPIAMAASDVMKRFKVDVIPTTYVVAPDGVIVRSFVGAVSEAQLDRAIRDAEARALTVARSRG